jgi:hypothetical protein
MQFPILENYTSIEWEEIFKQLPLVKSEEDKEIIKNILCKDKQWILREKETLKRYWVDNWVWPWYIAWFFRAIISLFFASVENTLHDIAYLIGWTLKDRLKADWGLLKYSYIWLCNNINTLLEMNYGIVAKVLIVAFSLLISILEMWVVLFCFLMVLIFWGLGSFNYTTYENHNN